MLGGLSSRAETTEIRIGGLRTEQQNSLSLDKRGKATGIRNERCLWEPWENYEMSNIYIVVVPEVRRKEQRGWERI